MEENLNGDLWRDSLDRPVTSLTFPSSPEFESDRISEFLYGDQEDALTDSSDYKNTATMLPEQLAEQFKKNAKVASNYENMQQTNHFTIAYFQLFENTTPRLVQPRKVPRVIPDVHMDDDAASSESSVYMSEEEDHFVTTRNEYGRDRQVGNIRSDLEHDEDMDSQSPAVTAPSSPVLSVTTSQASASSFHHSQNEDFVQGSRVEKVPRIIRPSVSTVGTIPSNMNKVSLNYQHSNNSPLPATLALRPTLPFSTKNTKYDDGTVFSGPHHLPEKYSIQPCVDYRKRHLIPDEIYYQHIKPSRYFVSQVNPFFEAAMGDASQFTSYNHYNPSDPVNFRHSYPLTKGHNRTPSRLDSIHSQQRHTIYGESSVTPRLSPRGIPKRRRFKAAEYIEESDASQEGETTSHPMTINETTNEINGKEMSSLETSLYGEQMKAVTTYKVGKFEQWLRTWKQSDPEACCICFSKKTTSHNPLVYCDNPFCEVIVHQKCYNIDVLPDQEDPWYCDRCNHKPTPNKITTTCPFCPSVKGAFCELDSPIFGCDWAHLLCIKYAFEDLYCYNQDSNKYEVLIDKATAESLNTTCSLCDIKEYSGFGAKICCQLCPERYHVTCGVKEGLCWINDVNRVQSLCPQHKKTNTSKDSPTFASKQWHDWVAREDEAILKIFGKSINGFILESWKSKVGSMKFQLSDSLYDSYQKFKSVITSFKVSDLKAEFYEQVNRVLFNIQKKYIASLLQENNDTKGKGKDLQAKNVKKPSSDHSEKRLKLLVSKAQESSESDSRRSSLSDSSTSSSTSDQMGTGKTNKFMMQDLAIGSTSKDTQPHTTHKTNKKRKAHFETFKSKKARTLTKKSPARTSKKTTPTPSSKSTSNNETTSKHTINTNKITTTTKSTPSRKQPVEEIKPTECFVCHQLELPDEVRIKLKLPENYHEKLEETKDKRRPGCTGYGDYWDPRVLIKCRDCNNFIHCGCPEIPITRYDPKKRGEAFICVQCDNPKEDDILKYYNQPRTIKRINYKV